MFIHTNSTEIVRDHTLPRILTIQVAVRQTTKAYIVGCERGVLGRAQLQAQVLG